MEYKYTYYFIRYSISIIIFLNNFFCFAQVKCFDTIQQRKILNSLKNEKLLMQIVAEQDTVIDAKNKIIIAKDNIIIGLENKYNAERKHNDYLNNIILSLSKENNLLRRDKSKLQKKARQRPYWFISGVVVGVAIVLIL